MTWEEREKKLKSNDRYWFFTELAGYAWIVYALIALMHIHWAWLLPLLPIAFMSGRMFNMWSKYCADQKKTWDDRIKMSYHAQNQTIEES